MTLTTGQTVFLAFATPNSSDGKPGAWVTAAEVLDAGNRVVRRSSGQVEVLEPWRTETVHATEADAWAWCRDRLTAAAEATLAKASECEAKRGAA